MKVKEIERERKWERRRTVYVFVCFYSMDYFGYKQIMGYENT